MGSLWSGCAAAAYLRTLGCLVLSGVSLPGGHREGQSSPQTRPGRSSTCRLRLQWRAEGEMAHILSVLLALAPVQAQVTTLKHVKEGQEYLAVQHREQEVRSPKFHDFSSAVPEDKFTSCSHGEDETSLFDFSSEDIEKRRNVSFSHQNYTGHVSLVVNLASF